METPINKAVTYIWHKEHCQDSALHGRFQDNYTACSTCGHYVQLPNDSTGTSVNFFMALVTMSNSHDIF